MSVVVSEEIVQDLKVSFNPIVVAESKDAEDAILECLDGGRFAVVRRELAIYSGFFKWPNKYIINHDKSNANF